MSQPVRCPHCDADLRDVSSSDSATCPACGTKLPQLPDLELGVAVPGVPEKKKLRLSPTPDSAPAQASHAENEHFEKAPHEEYARWRSVATGMRLLVGVAVLFALTNMGLTLYAEMSRPGIFEESFDIDRPQTSFLIAGCSTLTFMFFTFVGLLMCSGAPFPPARSHAMGAIFCLAGVAAGSILYAYLLSAHRYGRESEFIDWLSMGIRLLGAGVVVFFVLFQQEVANRFDHPRLHSMLNVLLWAWGICVVANVIGAMHFSSLKPWERHTSSGIRAFLLMLNLVLSLWIPFAMIRTSNLIDACNRKPQNAQS